MSRMRMVQFRNATWILLCLVQFVLSIDSSKFYRNDEELIAASIMCRHGDRNIIQGYPTDPWRSPEFWAEGFGELTNQGKQNHYMLGQYFRKRYDSLIPDGKYSPDEIHVQSTDVNRVLMSASANLAGMFPPSDKQVWNPSLPWQPIPVHARSNQDDDLLAPSRPCNRSEYLMFEFLNQTDHAGLYAHYGPLIRFVEKNSGQKMDTFLSFTLLYDTLLVESLTGKCLPKWAELLMQPDGDFEYLAARWYQIQTVTKEMQKLKAGFLLREILQQFTDKIQLNTTQQLWMYFAHDVTVANMMNTLGFFDPPYLPAYASCMFFELYQTKGNGTSYVKIFSKPKPEAETEELLIEACGGRCTLDDMYRLFGDVLPTEDYDTECKLRDGETLQAKTTTESYAAQVK